MKKRRKTEPLRIGSIEFIRMPYDGPIAVGQRIQTLIEVAIDVGLKEGLFKNSKRIEAMRTKGGQDVTDKRNIRDREDSPAGQDHAGDQERD